MSRSSVEWYKHGQHNAEMKFAPMISLPQPATLINGVYTTVPQYAAPQAPLPFKPIPLTGDDDDNEDPSQRTNILPMHGSTSNYNMNTLLHSNIQESEYFRALYQLKTYHEVIDEIYRSVQHVEAWQVGTSRIPSTCFCLLLKFMLMKLTLKQMKGILETQDCPYVRAVGFLYLRYTCPPKDLWKWYEPYLEDDEEINPSADPSISMTIGEYCIKLLTDMQYFGTTLPRIPVPIERKMKVMLLLLDEKKRRRRTNLPLQEDGLFCEGAKVKAIYGDDENEPCWYEAVIDSSHEEYENKYWVTFPEYGNTECVDIGDMEIVPVEKEKEKRISRSRDRSREKDKERDKDREKERERSREKDRSKDGSKAKRDRSDSRDRTRNRDSDRNRESSRDRNRDSDRDKKRDADRNRDSERGNRDRSKDRGKDKDREKEKDGKKRGGSRDRERERSRERDSKTSRDVKGRDEKSSKNGDRSRSRDRGRDEKNGRNGDRASSRDREKDREKDRGRDGGRDGDRKRDRSRDRSWDRDRGDRSKDDRNRGSRSRSVALDRDSRDTRDTRDKEGKEKDAKEVKEVHEESLMEKVMKLQRDASAAVGRNYGNRPASYKGSLALKVDRFTVRKRSQSPERRGRGGGGGGGGGKRRSRSRSPGRSNGGSSRGGGGGGEESSMMKVEVSREQLDRMRRLREQYGDASAR